MDFFSSSSLIIKIYFRLSIVKESRIYKLNNMFEYIGSRGRTSLPVSLTHLPV